MPRFGAARRSLSGTRKRRSAGKRKKTKPVKVKIKVKGTAKQVKKAVLELAGGNPDTVGTTSISAK